MNTMKYEITAYTPILHFDFQINSLVLIKKISYQFYDSKLGSCLFELLGGRALCYDCGNPLFYGGNILISSEQCNCTIA